MSSYIKCGGLVAAALSACLALAMPAQAASFDCAKASTKVEHIICDNPEISKQDEELAERYKIALRDEKQADSIKQVQKQWMKERNGCADEACVKNAYDVRLRALEQQAEAKLVQAVQKTIAQQPIDETVCLAPKIDWRNYEWTLITGKGLPVCEEMLAYVKSRPVDGPPPTCPGERLPQNGNWTRPEIRDVSEEGKQAILKDIPEQWRNKPVGVSYERRISNSQRLRVIRGDITRDGKPESMLALGGWPDIRRTCERSKRCAVTNRFFPGAYENEIDLKGDYYDLLPMNDEGTQVNWSHRTVRSAPMLMLGELVYYKGLPYWMSHISWGQASHDDFLHSSMRPDDPYSAIFMLSEIGVSTGNTKKGDTPNFKDITVVAIEHDPESNRVCRFGYLHRDNLKQNPPKAGR